MATIVKRGNAYRVQIRASHAEAKRWATRAEASVDRGKRVDLRTTTFADILTAYAESVGSMSRSKEAG
ncbi:hypothetical protein [Benzoatithermus flavus]|uniref:Site-specific integrase n=1 Tax=Benzoatithermus flavus TaxID=3108223 RepID=A0ABU8XNC5_9PROT